MIKKLFGLTLLITCLLFGSFSLATNYTCGDSFTITEDSYFIINYENGVRGFFDVSNSKTNEDYCYTNNNGIILDNSCSPFNSFPLVLSPGTWDINCSSISNSSFSVVPAISSCPSCTECSSSFCQTEYNLIPISSVDSSYCLTNNLCPLISTGEDSNWSALYINSIQHNSAPLINITIPEEFNRDYTGNDEYFDLSISGYNVDSDYIAGIIENQTTTPNSTDFNNLISGILPLFVPGLVIVLFLYFVFRFIKKIF